MAYKQISLFNLENFFLTADNTLLKSREASIGWNSVAQSIEPLSEIEPGVGFKIFTPFSSTSNKFVLGISSKPVYDIKWYFDLDISLFFNLEDFGEVTVFKGKTKLFSTPYNSQYYELKFIDNSGTLRLSSENNSNLFEFSVSDISLPKQIYILGYNNFSYPINILYDSDAIPEVALTSVTPSLTTSFSTTGTVDLAFEEALDDSTVSKASVILREYLNPSLEVDYTVSLENNNIIHIDYRNLNNGKVYEIELLDSIISKISGTHIKHKKLRFTTAPSSSLPSTTNNILSTTSPNDIYYKISNFESILDIDSVIFEGDKFNFDFKPTEYNPILKKYEIQYDAPFIEHDNKNIILDLYQKQFLPELTNYFTTIKLFKKKYIDENGVILFRSIDSMDYNKLLSLLLKNILNINSFKGNATQIKFLLSIYANFTDEHLVWVDPDPFLKFKYRVSSDVHQEAWTRDVKDTTHPDGFRDKYIFIPDQYPVYLELITNKELKFSVNYNYIDNMDVQFMKRDPNRNIKHIVLEEEHLGNMLWNDMNRVGRLGFKINYYNVNTPNYNKPDLLLMYNDASRKSISSTQLYANGPREYSIKFRSSDLPGIDYELISYSNNVLNFTKESYSSNFDIAIPENISDNFDIILNIKENDFTVKKKFYCKKYLPDDFFLTNKEPLLSRVNSISKIEDNLETELDFQSIKKNELIDDTKLITTLELNYSNVSEVTSTAFNYDSENKTLYFTVPGIGLEYLWIIDFNSEVTVQKITYQPFIKVDTATVNSIKLVLKRNSWESQELSVSI